MDSKIRFLKVKTKKSFKSIKLKKSNNNPKNIISHLFSKRFFIIIISLLLIYNFFITMKLFLKKIDKKDINQNSSNIFNFSENKSKTKQEILEEKIKLLKLITNNNPLIYEGIQNCLLKDPDEQLCLYHLIYPKKVVGKNKIYLIGKTDGSYITLDDFENIKIAYSFGIANIIQFDTELAKRNIDIYMYDHTINGLPYENPKFHWKKIGICGNSDKADNLKTLEELITENGHTSEKNMILKIDVEKAEWNALNETKDEIFKQFKYILIEYHFHLNPHKDKLYYDVIKKIHKTHQAFHYRCNSRELLVKFGNNIFCRTLEVSYIIREGNKFVKDDTIYPTYEFEHTAPQLGKFDINLNVLKLFDDDD